MHDDNLQKDAPKEICNDLLGLAMEAHALAICLDNVIFHDMGQISNLHMETRNSLDGLAKCLRRLNNGLVEGIERLDLATDWPETAKDRPKLVKS